MQLSIKVCSEEQTAIALIKHSRVIAIKDFLSKNTFNRVKNYTNTANLFLVSLRSSIPYNGVGIYSLSF